MDYEIKHVNIDLEIKEVNEKGHFSGYANTWEIDLGGDRLLPGAFKRTIKANKGKVAILKGHDSQREIGMSLSLSEDDKGLKFDDACLYIDDANPRNEVQDAREEYVRMKRRMELGKPIGISVGISVPNDKQKWNEELGTRDITEAKLWEFSTTPFPMNEPSAVDSVKSILGMPAMARKVAAGCTGPLCPKNKEAVETTIKTLQSLLTPTPEALDSVDSAKGGREPDKIMGDSDFHSLMNRLGIPTNK